MKKIIKTIVITFLLYSTGQIALSQKQSINYEGITRYYEIYLPENFEPNMPLVFCLHGWSETVDFIRQFTEFHNYADTAGFVVVYPEGINNSWNIGVKYDPLRSPFPDVDDVGFISTLIDTIYTNYNIDLKRIYGCGFSTGGDMAYRLACQIGERFAAIAPVAGGIYDTVVSWHLIKKIPVLHIHGTSDSFYRYYGPGENNSKEMWSVDETLDFWIEHNEANKPGDTLELPDLVPEDNCTAQKITFTGDSNSTPVIHYKILNGGHSWPGSPYTLGSWEGNRNMDFGAAEEIWNFFKKYENPLVNLARSKSLEVDPVLLSDSLTVRSYVSNPLDHPANVFAIIQGEQFVYSDTLQLFDDGLHHDGDSLDNLWGNKKELSGLTEDAYLIDLVTHDQSFNLYQYYHQPASLINFGPVEFENYRFDESDNIPNPGDRLKIFITLTNNSSTATATNLEANLASLDTLLTTSNYRRSFDDIPAGESFTSESYLTITITDDCPVNTIIPVQLNIFSHDNLCWIDTLNIQVVEPDIINSASELITRIYPNPSDGIINIETDYFDNSIVEIYSISGLKLLSISLQSNSEGIDVSGLPKGIYFLKVKQVNRIYFEKIIVR
jgi:polyhydroxybutyrate depolymerase